MTELEMLEATEQSAAASQASADAARWSIFVSSAAVLITLGVGLWTIRENKESNGKQLERLDLVAKHIENATNRQLAEHEKRILEKHLVMYNSALVEIDSNLAFLGRLRKNKLAYLKGRRVIMSDLSLSCLDNLLREVYRGDNETFLALIGLRSGFDSLNSIFSFARVNTHDEITRKATYRYVFNALNDEMSNKYVTKARKAITQAKSRVEKELGNYVASGKK